MAIPGYRRALFIRFGGLGDILLATPTVRALARAYPGIIIDFVVGGGMADALNGHPLVRNVLVFNKRGADARLDNFVPFLVRLAREHYDLTVNLHPSAKSFAMAAVSRARTHLMFRKQMGVDAETGRVAHAVDDFLKELRPLGISETQDRHLDFVVPPEARGTLDALLLMCGVRPEERLLVINPAASRPLNRWPLERFAQVAARFADVPDVRVIVTGAPSSFQTVMDGLDEISLAQNVAAADPRILNLAGRLSIKEFGALLQCASAFLTCDTGPMHIASALDTPMVTLSGAADPDRTGPLNPNSTVLIDRQLPCVPCRDRICRRGDVKCMDDLSVERVMTTLDAMLSRRTREPHIALPVF
jgi:heptosyltransferase-2